MKRKRKLKSALVRGYEHLVAVGAQHSDWIMSGVTDDAELRTNIAALRSRCRDLWKTNPYVRKFRSDLLTNVFGSNGISLQMKIKEEADRVVYAPDEKSFLTQKQAAHDARVKFLAKRGIVIRQREIWSRNERGEATILAGQPDVYANNLIERAFRRWQKKENCTIGKRHTYAQVREQRLSMAARDGDCFIRLIQGKSAKNEFNFAVQVIASEYVDWNLNEIDRPDGHEIRAGIEYDATGEVIAYHLIKPRPQQWRYSVPVGEHERVPARDMIHYCAFEDSNSGRAAPWISAIISKARHLEKGEEAEVVAARAEACKGGHYVPEIGGVDAMDLADTIEKNKGELSEDVEPGMWKALPFGWKPQAHDPTHPNGNYPAFRKDILRGIAAGLPASHYNTLGSDYESVNYSSYKAARIDVNEVYKCLQRFDIDTAERPIFERWLEMALASGAIPLPVLKIEKFKAARFQGRRWEGLEPLKEANANQKNLALMLTSRTRITEERGIDFEEVLEELAMEKALIEDAGFSAEIVPDKPGNEPADDEPEIIPATNGNGKSLHHNRL